MQFICFAQNVQYFFIITFFIIIMKILGLSKQLKKVLSYWKLHYKYENFKGER